MGDIIKGWKIKEFEVMGFGVIESGVIGFKVMWCQILKLRMIKLFRYKDNTRSYRQDDRLRLYYRCSDFPQIQKFPYSDFESSNKFKRKIMNYILFHNFIKFDRDPFPTELVRGSFTSEQSHRNSFKRILFCKVKCPQFFNSFSESVLMCKFCLGHLLSPSGKY